METCYKDGKLIINKLSKNYSFGKENIYIDYNDPYECKDELNSTYAISNTKKFLNKLDGYTLEDLKFIQYYRGYEIRQGLKYLNTFNFFGWLSPYSLGVPILTLLNKCLEEHLRTGEISLIDESSFNYLVSRHYSEFKDLLMKWAYSLDIGKVTLFNAREALYTTQDKFDLEEKVFIFRKSTFMSKGKLTKFKNISRVDVRHKIVKASMKEEPIFIIKFTGIEPENLVTRYKKEVSKKEFYFYNFILMLMNL